MSLPVDYESPVKLCWFGPPDLTASVPYARGEQPISCTLGKAIELFLRASSRRQDTTSILLDAQPALDNATQLRTSQILEIAKRDDYPS